MPLLSLSLFDDLANSFYKTFIHDGRYMSFLQGLGNTLMITFFATLIGIIIGMIVAIIRVYHYQTGKLKAPNAVCSAYTAVIRGTPVMVQVMIMYMVVFAAAPTEMAPLIAILSFGLNSGAYVSEIVRGGILGVDGGQMEAGRSLGLTQGQAMKSIVLPQAIKSILPALGNEFIVLLKETAIVGTIGVIDLTRAADLVRSRTFDAFFPLIAIALIYFILVVGISALLKKAERRLAKSDRR